ncbi:MAG: hypothetical protein J6A60_04950, partial [Clostridia bacterium]|nr:hypothetical protein [Clostridia bacterium]
RSFGLERRQPVVTLNRQKSSENPSFSGRRFFVERIFRWFKAKTEQIPDGFASILTQKQRK